VRKRARRLTHEDGATCEEAIVPGRKPRRSQREPARPIHHVAKGTAPSRASRYVAGMSDVPRTAGVMVLFASAMLASCADEAGSPAASVEGAPGPDAQVAAPPEAIADADSLDASLDGAVSSASNSGADAGQLGADAALGSTACSVQWPTACPDPAPRYNDVVPIFNRRCVTCHSGWAGPWPLTSYTHVVDWQDTIRTELIGCTMPPPDAGIPITNDERTKILTWLRCGYPM
jgi:hypothetical protein